MHSQLMVYGLKKSNKVIIMYTIVMDKYKQLNATIKTILYQRENLTEKVQFLIPEYYNEIDLKEYTAILKYLDQSNASHAEILKKDDTLYKGKIRYILPINSELSKFSGDISIRITFTKVDMDMQTQYVLHTGEISITISPLKDYYTFVPDESLEFVDQLVGNLEAKLEATERIAEIYDNEKADNITYENNDIQLTSNGKKIGNSINISDGSVIANGFNVIEF